NDNQENIKALKQAIKKIKPDLVQLNTVSRPAPGNYAQPLDRNELNKIASKLEGPVDVIGNFEKTNRKNRQTVSEVEIISMLQRRPCTIDDVCEALGAETTYAKDIMEKLTKAGKLCKINHTGKIYYHPS
ncbi:MAG: hypothetical protein KAJ45_07930, partial [Desulfobulbaceae bacterium]|nr:hypothetical protein [Desulfobulbaceae bacterium]